MKSTKTIITTIVLVMTLLQGPVIYYYCGGFGGFLVLLPYSCIGLGLTIFLISLLRKRRDNNTGFHVIGVSLSVVLGIATLFSEDVIEQIDWNVRKSERNRIVEQIKEGRLDAEPGQQVLELPGINLPPLSNGGNQIVLIKHDDKTISVEFNINPGLLDHYSAFKYTDNPEEIIDLNNLVKDKKPGFKRLDTNWYRVNY